jgi:hypothetical protein
VRAPSGTEQQEIGLAISFRRGRRSLYELGVFSGDGMDVKIR